MKSYAQYNEDLFISNIFGSKDINKGFFLEFGAWDGKYLSNCRFFYEKGWKGLFIEGNKDRFVDLQKNYDKDKNIILLNLFVDKEENSLDKILLRENIYHLDLLSIDVDGKDLILWKTLTKIRPKVIIIEFNSTIPFDVNYIDGTQNNIGSSLVAINNYAKENNYQLIHATPSNLIFIEKQFNLNFFKVISEIEVYNILNPIRTAYNNYGEILFFKGNQLNQNEYFRFPSQKDFITFQPIPKFIRKLTNVNGKGNKLIKIIYSNFLLILLRPNLFIHKLMKKFFN